MPLLRLGLRVVRGPKWKSNVEDGGDGFVGTVAEIKDKNIVVQWDIGKRCKYGLNDELLVYDAGTTGMSHFGVQCDECNEMNVKGLRWKCQVCNDFDLCTSCYNLGKHDLEHAFWRYTEGPQRVNVGARNGSPCKTAYGLFPGATVTRGPNWKWQNQDGGDGNQGTIVQFYNWKERSLPDALKAGAKVSWNKTGISAEYRICFEGKCDLIAVKPEKGGSFYYTHLPALDDDSLTTRVCEFADNDKVCVHVPKEQLKRLQDGHGGWNDAMGEFVGRIGTVSRIYPSGDVGVEYEPHGLDVLVRMLSLATKKKPEWLFNPAALKKVETFTKGDMVTVMDNEELVKRMQENHGGWTDPMAHVIGKSGEVDLIDKDGDVRVRFGAIRWTFSPAALQKGGMKNNECTSSQEKISALLAKEMLTQYGMLEQGDSNVGGDESIIAAAALGRKSKVESMLNAKPELARLAYAGKTALQLACHKGNLDIVELLLTKGAEIERADDEGDTPLHFATICNELKVAQFLVGNGVNLNIKNKKGMTPLHIAAYMGNTILVEYLIGRNADMNTQDLNGDTPLHDAITKENSSTVDRLLDAPTIDCLITNFRGFNPLHHAVLTGKERFVEKILQKFPHLVHVQKEDGFAALHLAVVNGYEGLVKFLLTKAHAEVDLKTNNGQTPLLLAAHEGYLSIVICLLNYGADINAEDDDGDTTLHNMLHKHSSFSALADQFLGDQSLKIPEIVSQFDKPKASPIVIASYLVRAGANMKYCNHNGVEAYNVCNNDTVKALLTHFKEEHDTGLFDTAVGFVPAPIQETAPEPQKVTSVPEQSAVPLLSTLPSQPSLPSLPKCEHCHVNFVDARFRPCNHEVVCKNCVDFYKICRTCRAQCTFELFVPPGLPTCKHCETNLANVILLPCNHTPLCHDCSKPARRCRDCGVEIRDRVVIGPEPAERRGDEPIETCKICMDRPRNVVFQCGHSCCKECSKKLKECHMCRELIRQTIPLYNN